MTENKKCVVAFDTSNYTTSVAVCTLEGEVVANLKAPLQVKQGERGLRQSDAVFAHTKNLPALCKELGCVELFFLLNFLALHFSAQVNIAYRLHR